MTTIYDFFRRTGRTLQTVPIDDNLDSLPIMENRQHLASPEAQLMDQELDEDLQSALNALPEGMLAPLLLREIQELSYKEIAEVLGVPMGTVMSRLARARAALHNSLVQKKQDNKLGMATGE